MTSAQFEVIPVADIRIDREHRQRRTLKNIDDLAESIRQHGLINPIVVTRDRVLVAGERRLTAHQLLKFDSIAVQYADTVDPYQLHLIELEENIKREELPWQDHVKAVADYHNIKSNEDPEWTQEKTGAALGMHKSYVQSHLIVKQAIDEEVPEVLEAPKLTTALNFVKRKRERQKMSAVRDIKQTLVSPSAESETSSAESADATSNETGEPAPTANPHLQIEQADFSNWSKIIQTNPYNLIHCDFPYGVSAGDTKGQSAAKSLGGYDDRPEIYFNLLETFCNRLDNFCAPSAHLVFWFSMDYYEETLGQLRAAGWNVSPFPLVWYKSDNTGILPDSNRGPRRIYETAFFGHRGGRPVVRAVGNAVAAGTTARDEKIHMSEKPLTVLDHFFRMLVDDTTRLLDPTCGSGNAIKAAHARGASFSHGLDLEEEYVLRARESVGLD